MKMSVTPPGSTPASASAAARLPAFGPKLLPAPVSNSSTRSAVLTSSGSRSRWILSVGCPAALSSALTSSGVRPTPKILLSLGNSSLPSRNAVAESSPMVKDLNVASFGGGGGASAAGAGGGVVCAAGGSAGLEQAASTTAATKARAH